MRKKVTIKDIAESAGVSIGTVDRVLHNRGEVSKKTKELVLRIAKEKHYSTNIFARNLKLSKEYLITAVVPSGNQYWELQHTGLQDAAEEYKNQGIRLTTYPYNIYDETTFVEQLHKAMADKPDGMVIAPFSKEPTRKVVNDLEEEGIPYVFIDSTMADTNPLSFIGQDSYQSGFLAAKLLCYGLQPSQMDLRVVYQKSDIHNKAILDRIEGFIQYVNEEFGGAVKIARYEIENIESLKKLDFFTDEHAIQLFVPNTKAYLLAEKLSEKRAKKQVRLIGYDLTPQNSEYVALGLIDFIIHPKPALQGFTGIETLYKHLILKQKVALEQFMPLEIITQENLRYYQ
jgi:LacI family transcriptional regulator